MNIEQKTITSLEVADMIGKNHKELLRDIRRYVEQFNERKIAPVGFFNESEYQDTKGEMRPCFLVTKKGCEFIAHKLTGIKGTEFTVKYINKFHEMEKTIRTGQMKTSPSLQVLQGMLDQLIRQDAEIRQASAQSQQAIDTTQNIKDTIVGVYDDWRDWVRQTISKIQKGSGMTYQDVYSTLYDQLEKRAKCRLSVRVDNQRKRMALDGATKTKIESYRTLDAIEDDQRLKEIFSTIVKEYAIRYVA